MTTYRIAAPAAADNFMIAHADSVQGEHYALSAVKGKATDKALNALNQGAVLGAMLANATGAVRKTLCTAEGARAVAHLGQQVAHADYRRAIASVAGAANHAFTMALDAGKGPARNDWLRLGLELSTVAQGRTKQGNVSPAAKMAQRGLDLHRDIQAHADSIRAVAEAARKAASVNPEEMAQRAIAQG